MAITFLTNEDKTELEQKIAKADLFTKQNPTPEQQAQARENAGAVSAAEVETLIDAKLSSITNAEEVAY